MKQVVERYEKALRKQHERAARKGRTLNTNEQRAIAYYTATLDKLARYLV